MGGQTRVEYRSPNIERDDSFQRYLEYQQERERTAEQRAQQERDERRQQEDARRASGQRSLAGMRAGIESQLRGNLISYTDAVSQLRDYASRYGIDSPEADINRLTNIYTSEIRPGRQQTGIGAAYEELLGRQATEAERATATQRFQQGYYSSVQDLRESLTRSQEYQDKFNQSYLDNYYDTQFGKQTVDDKGKKTGKRTFTFDKNLLPTIRGNVAGRTGVELPTFQDTFTGTPAEIEEQLQNVRSTRQYIYSAGLTNLQGEIDKETQKLKNEGTKEVARIGRESSMYSNLLSGFWS